MKVLLVNGSPNEHGCTFTALSEAADTLHKHSTEIAEKPEAPEGVVKAIKYYIEGGCQASSEIAGKGFSEAATM